MKVLILCVFKEDLAENAAPFVVEQKRALQRYGVECHMFLVKGKGVRGYLKQLGPLKKSISSFQPDVIHAHFGLCGLLANLQRRVPVVTTYHGSDINDRKVRRFSRIAMHLSQWNIFVSRKTMNVVHPKKHYSLLPCGVDLAEMQLTSKVEARRQLGLDQKKHYILFAGAFHNQVKNATLAQEAVACLNDNNTELLELKGYSREEVTLLMCAADVFLMTSVAEGSPQVIKEALACGCPIVSVDVGDVGERINGTDGCYVAQSYHPMELMGLIQKALLFDGRTNGRERIINDGLENESVAGRLKTIYQSIIYAK